MTNRKLRRLPFPTAGLPSGEFRIRPGVHYAFKCHRCGSALSVVLTEDSPDQLEVPCQHCAVLFVVHLQLSETSHGAWRAKILGVSETIGDHAV
jgi:DNA-directed RNA polymerase subunit RPC12/RpoP